MNAPERQKLMETIKTAHSAYAAYDAALSASVKVAESEKQA